jgi:hypothetical protein
LSATADLSPGPRQPATVPPLVPRILCEPTPSPARTP